MAQAHRHAARNKKAQLAEDQSVWDSRTQLHSKGTALAISVLAFIVYSATLYPSLPPGDSGELIVGVHLSGVLHPPGYPVYLLLAKAFSLLPFGSPAWKLNLFSAVCGSLAAGVLSLATSHWSRSAWAGFAAGGLFAFSPLIWQYSVGAEVFALHNLIIASLLLLSVLYANGKSVMHLRMGALVLGIGMSHHQTTVFYGIPLVIWAVAQGERAHRQPREIAKLAGLFALGLAPYLVLPLFSESKSPLAWGDLSSLEGFLKHVFRKEYGTFQLALESAEDSGFLRGILEFLRHAVTSSWGIGAGLASYGIYSRIQREEGIGLAKFWGGALLAYLVAFHSMANKSYSDPVSLSVVSRFWQQPDVIVYSFAGIGLATLFRIPLLRSKPFALPAATVALVVLQTVLHYRESDQSQNRIFEQFGRAILAPLPQNAVVFIEGDTQTNSVYYLQECESFRKDVRVVARPLLRAPWYVTKISRAYPEARFPGARYHHDPAVGFNLKALIDSNVANGARAFMSEFAKDGSPEGDDRSWQADYRLWPIGFFVEARPSDRPFDVRAYLSESQQALESFDPHVWAQYQTRPWESFVLGEYWHMQEQRITAAMAHALPSTDAGAIEAVLGSLDALLKQHPSTPANLYRMQGAGYHRLIGLGKDISRFAPPMIEAFENYVARAEPGEADVVKARALISQFKK